MHKYQNLLTWYNVKLLTLNPKQVQEDDTQEKQSNWPHGRAEF